MPRKKKTSSILSVDLSIPACLGPLVNNKKIMTYVITRCTTGTSNKLYIFIVATHNKKMYLARFWGPFDGGISGMHEDYDKDTFQKLINEKAKKGYTIEPNHIIIENSDVYSNFADEISDYITNMSKISAGSKVPLPLNL